MTATLTDLLARVAALESAIRAYLLEASDELLAVVPRQGRLL